MPGHVQLTAPVEKQLLIQLGERLKRARQSQQLTAVSLAKTLGMSRSTLHAAEAGDPSATVGTYVRILGALGLVSDLALVASGAEPKHDARAAHTDVDADLVSRALHSELARRVAARPSLRVQARALVARAGVLSALTDELAQRFRRIVETGDIWELLEDSIQGRAMRDSSPLLELVPESKRDEVVGKFLRTLRRRESLTNKVTDGHRPQDLQSLMLHKEAVRLVRDRPELVERALSTLSHWRESADPRSFELLDEWVRIIRSRDWTTALQENERGNQLRQASPMATLLPNDVRLRVISEVKAMKMKRECHATT